MTGKFSRQDILLRSFLKITFLFIIFGAILTFSPGNLNAGMSNEDCLSCHGDKDIEAETERGKKLELFVPENALLGSVHEELSCTDCHIGEKSFEDIPHCLPLTDNQ